MATIVQKENPVLRRKAERVPISLITSPKIKRLIASMQEAVNKEEDGVAIAACQIGVPVAIFIVSGRAFDIVEGNSDSKSHSPLVCINPEILKESKKKQWVDEGCLSVRWLYGKVKRNIKLTIKAYDEKGKRFTRGASGLIAQIFQHEIDHLEGKLFTDKAKEVREIPPLSAAPNKKSEKVTVKSV